MSLANRLFGFKGRLRRQDWWILGLAVGLVSLVIEVLVNRVVFPGAFDFDTVTLASPGPILATAIALSALSLWPTAALYAKRAHDLNWPAWPAVTSLLLVEGVAYLPYDLAPAFAEGPHTAPQIALTAATCALVIVVFGIMISLGFIDGARGPNRYGPSPKAHEVAPLPRA